MGDGYVNMTNENIAKGDPFGVYKQENEFLMFLQIGANNIYVATIYLCFGDYFFLWFYCFAISEMASCLAPFNISFLAGVWVYNLFW